MDLTHTNLTVWPELPDKPCEFTFLVLKQSFQRRSFCRVQTRPYMSNSLTITSNMSDPGPECAETRSRHPPVRKFARRFLPVGILVWAAVVATGLWFLWGYENAPGEPGKPPRQWPSVSRIQLGRSNPTLVMLAHPRCPCTRASIGELARIMAHGEGRLNAHVLFVRPAGFDDDWERSDLWQSAAGIPGVNVVSDPDGAEAHLFNAATSGQTALYNTEGQLIFSGGITGARGHHGDNAGQSAIIAIVTAAVPERTETAVFGCPLSNPFECQVTLDERNQH